MKISDVLRLTLIDKNGYIKSERLHKLEEVHEWFMKTYGIRVFPTQKVSGGFGVEFYKSTNNVGLPFKRIQCSAFTKSFKTFYDAIDGGIVFALTELVENEDLTLTEIY